MTDERPPKMVVDATIGSRGDNLDEKSTLERSKQPLRSPPPAFFQPKKPISIPFLLITTSMAMIYPGANQMSTNVSLVKMNVTFACGMETSQWVMLIYQLFSSTMVAFAGCIGQKIGMALLFRIGIITLVVCDIGVGLSPNIPIMLVFRAFNGVAVACISSTYAVIQRMFARPESFGRLIQAQSVAMAVANIIFPLLAGFVNDSGENNWRINYFILAVLSTVSSVISLVKIPATPRMPNTRFDVPGFIFFFLTVASIIVFLGSFSFGWSWVVQLVLGVAFVLFVALLLLTERRPPGTSRTLSAPPALLPLGAIANRNSLIFFANTMLVMGAFAGTNYLVPYLLAVVYSYNSTQTGLLIAIISIGTATISLALGRAIKNVVSRVLYFFGIFAMSVGLYGQSMSAFFQEIIALIVCLYVCGLGMGLFSVSNMGFIFKIAGENLGLFGGLMSTFMMVGQAMFTSIASSLLGVMLDVILAHYDYVKEEDLYGDQYAEYYGMAVGSAILVFGTVVLAASLLTFLFNSIEGERGQIGFKERNLPKNRRQVVATTNDVELVTVNTNTSDHLAGLTRSEPFFRDIDVF
eukprot:gnl/Chilomastix_cuspidata/1975.p1 GENE.gnl/Chilomastix_cuspidata/1975~~gnl/Chilomastix_cuspidata/1975.p1  ORF type:complete len:580 (+),score=202.09 gnl/Chilomastix_cuspidata/1975:58-1797(+)